MWRPEGVEDLALRAIDALMLAGNFVVNCEVTSERTSNSRVTVPVAMVQLSTTATLFKLLSLKSVGSEDLETRPQLEAEHSRTPVPQN